MGMMLRRRNERENLTTEAVLHGVEETPAKQPETVKDEKPKTVKRPGRKKAVVKEWSQTNFSMKSPQC